MTRFVFAAAGTGGHLFPALAVADALVERSGVDREDVLFVGGDRIEARVVPEAGYRLLQVELRGLRRSLDRRNLGIPRVVAAAARSIAAELWDPAVVAAFGGYVTGPAAWAARRRKAPLVVHEQNAVPGLANRLAARFARRVLVGFPEAARALPRAEVVGVPLRASLLEERDRAEARLAYGLDPELPTVGILGGSQGAAVLNAAAEQLASLEDGKLQILHLTGPGHEERWRAVASDRGAWTVLGFEPDMARFYAAVDLVVSRAGAGTVAELAATGTPAVMVPYAAGAAGHQAANAVALAGVGGALVVEEPSIASLPGRVLELLGDRVALDRMAEAARAVGRPAAADTMASILLEVADG